LVLCLGPGDDDPQSSMKADLKVIDYVLQIQLFGFVRVPMKIVGMEEVDR
jgi:hypothetical protein